MNTFDIDRSLLRQMIHENGGIRPFCKRNGINRQVIYNLLRSSLPDYQTICRISEGLSLTEDQITKVFFVRVRDTE